MRKNFTFLFALFLVIAGTVRAEVAADLAGKYFSVADPATTLQTDTWYLLKNQGRNAYISEQTTVLKMKSTAELADVNDAEANAGLLFKFSNGTAEGMYNIVSGNGKYFTIANSSSAVSATAVDYIVGNVAEGVFYIQDPATSVVADGNAAGGTFVGWGTTVPTSAGGNNSYQFMEVDFIDAETAEAFVNATNMLYDLQVTYGLVTDASKFSSNAPETTEGSFAALIDNNYGTFFHSAWSYAVEETHNLQMEVSEPTESIFFYFKKRSQNNNNRPTDITILGSNDGETFTEIVNINSGFPTGASPVDYMSEVITASEAYKHFRFVVNATSTNTKFFTFSEFYLFPGNQAILDAIATSKALVEAGLGAENFDELKANFETAYNKVQEDKFNKLFNTAVAEAEALLAEATHAEVPAVGQYPTAAYNAFESAITTLKAEATQENLDAINAAIAEFVQTKNLPVFTIDGVINYAAGKSIYENGEGGLYFKATDLTDASMLWSFDMEGETIGVTDAVVVRNLATGNLFWGAPSIKVAETSEAIAEDGIFLFYTEGNGTPVHAQNNGQQVVRWNSTEATSGSAWMFTYVGTTYDLYDLDAPDWTDVTADYMTNADMSAADGWTLVNMTDNGPGEGYKFYGFYSGWGSIERTEGGIKQEVTLPAGHYRLTGKAFFRQGVSYNTDAKKSLGYMVAGDNKVLVQTLGSVEGLDSYANDFPGAHTALYEQDLYTNVLEFTLTEQTTLSIGYECTFDHIQSWFLTGMLKLESAQPVPGALFPLFEAQAMEFCGYSSMAMSSLSGVMARWEELTGVVFDVYGAISEGKKVLDAKVRGTMDAMTAMMTELKQIEEFYGEFNEIKFNCYDIQDNSVANTPEIATAFENVVSLSYNTADIATLADLQALADTLQYASRQYMLNAVPNDGYTFDYTFLIEGVGNSIEGWVKDIPGFSGNFVYKNSKEKDTETLKKTGFIEAWNPGAYTGTISYTKNDLPNGYYKISAYAFTNGTTSFFGNVDSVIVENTSMYVQPVLDSVMVINGTLKFGLAVENANWVGITNVELAFIDAIPDSILYGAQRTAFVEKAQEFTAYVEGNAALTMMYGIKGTYAWPLFDAVDPLVATINEVTDMALLDSLSKEMDAAVVEMEKAVVAYAEFSKVSDLFWTAADNSSAISQEVADARDMALMNSNYTTQMAATVADLETAVIELKAAYLTYVTNAVANEGFKFDVTIVIENPSFETGDLSGWEAEQANDTGAKLNSNATYTMTGCDGEYVFNTWYGTGIYVQQTVKELPAGVYALNVVLASDDILLEVTAGNKTLQHTCTGGKGAGTDVVVDSIVHEGGDFLIKVATVNNDWFKADNFRLYCLGAEEPEVVAPELNPIAVAPESGKELETLTELLLAYDAEVMVSEDCEETIKVTDVNGVVVAEATAENCMVDENEVVITFAEAIVVNGTYTVTVPAGMFLLNFEFESAAVELTYTIVNGIANIEAADDAVIYTITGKRIQGNVKSLERGIYIVNGKKVLVK